MHFLLVNKNAAVKKIFNITAKKAGIELDVVDSVDKIPLDKDYSCIFVDDDMLKTGDIGDFKTKMITTKFCVILSKDSPLVGGFDSYIRKPFLPTDIYEVLKKEKYNDMNGAYDEGDSGDDLGGSADSGGENGEIDANSDIDLSEFSDSEDEFLSGVKDGESSQDIDFDGNPMGDSVGDSGELSVDSVASAVDSSGESSDLGESLGNANAPTSAPSGDTEIPATFDLDSVDLGYLNDSANPSAGADLGANPAVDSPNVADLGGVDLGAVDLNAVAQSADLGDSVGADLNANAMENVAVDSMPNPPSDSPTPAVDSLNMAQDSVDFAQDALLDDINLSDSVAQSADIGANPSVAQLQESGIDLDLPSANQTTPIDSQPTPPPQKSQKDIFDEAESQIRNIKALSDKGGNFYNSANNADDIDFSQIMALQDEILAEEKAKNEKKSIIGGDIYTPKGESQSATQAQPTPDLATQPAPDLSAQPTPDLSAPESTPNIAPLDLADSPIDLAQDSAQNVQGDDFADLAVDSPVPSVDSSNVVQNDFIDLATDSPSADLADSNADLGADLSADSTAQMQNIALDSKPIADIAPQSVDLPKDSPLDLAQPQSADLAVDSINLATDSAMPSVDSSVDSIDLAVDSVAQPQDIDLAQDSQEPMKDAQGAEDDFLETLDFLKDPAPSVADSNIIDMSGDLPPPSAPPPDLTQSAPPPDLTQDSLDSIPPPAPPPPDLTQSAEPPKYEEYSFDSMANDDFDGLEGLSGISNIASDTPPPPPPKPTNKGRNDILSNLEISPQDNIDADYHADSVGASASQTAPQATAPQAPLNQSEDALNHIDEHNFNSAFSSGISAEMDSISPNFKAQDFIQDLTLGSETALPDFSKSLKQHTTAEQRYNMLGLPINDDGAVKDITDLSKNELENLDDEAILLLQENSLHNKSAPKSAQNDANDAQKSASDSTPKILDKQQIDDITNILEGTQKPSVGAPSGAKPQKPSVSINNNEFGSLTQEALSEVLGEDLDDDIADDLTSATPDIKSDSPKDSPKTAPTSANPNQPIPSQINLNDGNIDIANILQTFPIDKLRELLSGVQITVNITFPTKKQ